MKKLLSILMALCILFSFASGTFDFNVNAASNPYPTSQTIGGVSTIPCTWYAWQQAYDNTGVVLPNFGNAKNWYSSAQSKGYSVGTTAKPKSIAVWTNSGYGHVGYVVSVSGSTMKVNEGGMYNENGTACNGNGIINGSTCNSAVGSKKSSYSNSILVGFIYLDGSTDSSGITYKTLNSKDTISNTNAIVWAQIDKSSDASVSQLGIVVRKKCDTYSNGWSKYHAPSKNYVGSTVVQPYFNMNDELGLTLSPGIEYCYQFYAKIDGKDYWSNESSFKTTGSHTTHTRGGYAFFQATHPHYNCYYCTMCGEAFAVDTETNLYNGCDVCYSLGKSKVTTNKTTYNVGESVNINWSKVDKATYYMLWIEKKDINGEYSTILKTNGIKTNSFSTNNLSSGDYRVYHVTYNSNMWEKDDSDYRHTVSDYVYFSVNYPLGWTQGENGVYWACGDGTYAKGWKFIDIHWYYFDDNGYMTTYWQYINGNWYYMNYGGVMLKGWQFIDNNWYYFDLNGVMVSNAWVDGYYLSSSGAMTTPTWQQDSNGWWYSYGDGNYATGWAQIGGSWYYFNQSGYMQTGWQFIGNTWYYFYSGGQMATGWQWIGNAWYYFYSGGSMASNCYVGGYWLTASGAMA